MRQRDDSSASDIITIVLDNTTPPVTFEYILFERINPERNKSRYYPRR